MERAFIVDGMLGSLARKLRMYGFDVAYDPGYDDSSLLQIGSREGRVLLTADRELSAKALRMGVPALLIVGADDTERLAEVFTGLSMRYREPFGEGTRCPKCNGTLDETSQETVAGQLPDNVLKRHRTFYICLRCGKVYWQGSHWQGIRAFSAKVRKRLEEVSLSAHPQEISGEDGELAVRIARRAIEEYLAKGDASVPGGLPKGFDDRRGVFVTLKKHRKGGEELRGCVGFPIPEEPLVRHLVDAAIESAFADPRFPGLRPEELPETLIEVSILTPLELISVESPLEYPSKVEVGRDGLVVRCRDRGGLLLPQVAVEYAWSAEDFLSGTCMKAGLPPDSWLLPQTKIYRFQSIVFEETEPGGRVIRKTLR